MDERIKFFVGLDAHKDTIAVAACEAGREPARFAGTLGPDVRGLLKVLGKAGDPAAVSVVYEAGPTGYGLYRELSQRGYHCEIIAPTLIPRRAVAGRTESCWSAPRRIRDVQAAARQCSCRREERSRAAAARPAWFGAEGGPAW